MLLYACGPCAGAASTGNGEAFCILGARAYHRFPTDHNNTYDVIHTLCGVRAVWSHLGAPARGALVTATSNMVSKGMVRHGPGSKRREHGTAHERHNERTLVTMLGNGGGAWVKANPNPKKKEEPEKNVSSKRDQQMSSSNSLSSKRAAANEQWAIPPATDLGSKRAAAMSSSD